MANTSDDVKSDLDSLREDVRALRDDLGSLARDRASRVREAVGENARAAKDRAEDVVREHPLSTLALAAGTGALVGVLASRCGGR